MRGPWVDLGGADRDRRAGALFHVSVWGWPGQKWRRQSCWYPRQRLLLGIVHAAAAKEVTRHLGGELATFPRDPQGCRAVSADRDWRCFPLPRRQNRGTGTAPTMFPVTLVLSAPGHPPLSLPWPTSSPLLPSSSCSSGRCVPSVSFSPSLSCPLQSPRSWIHTDWLQKTGLGLSVCWNPSMSACAPPPLPYPLAGV